MVSLQIFLLWVTVGITLVMAYMAWQRRSAAGAKMLSLTLLTIAWWVFCYNAGSVTYSLPARLFWARLKFAGVALLPPFMLGFVLDYIHRDAWVRSRRFILLFIVPLVTLTAVTLDDQFHLFYVWADLSFTFGGLRLVTSPGPFFWLHTIYSYVLLLGGIILLGHSLLHTHGARRVQQWIILIAALVPWVANVVYIFSLNSMRMLDLTPVAFSITGAAIFMALFYYRLLDIGPVARSAVIEHMLDGMMVLDMERRVVEVNPAMRRWLGKSALQVIGHEIGDVLPDLIAQRPDIPMEDHTATEFETTFLGERRVLEVRFSTIKNQEGRSLGHVLMLRDVTARVREAAERERVEQSLWRMNELLERMFNNINLLVLYVDADLKVVRANKALADLLGWPADGLTGKPITDIYPMFRWASIYYQVLQTGEMATGEAIPLTLAEKTMYWDWSLQPVRSKDGAVEGLVLAMIDVTKRKKAEEELRRSEQAEREQRMMAETFRDTSAALNSTIQIDSVLSLILTSIERVVDHSAAYVVLNDEMGSIIRWRFRGYTIDEERDILELRKQVSEPVSTRRGITRQMSAMLVPDVFYIPDVLLDPVYGQYTVMRKFRSYLGTPIRIKGKIAGFINLASEKVDCFNAEDAGRLRVFADQAAIAVENARLYEEVEYLTLTDELTGVYNYRGLIELGQREFDRARRFGRALSLLFFDIDHFREFNNLYSHELGNMVLQMVAQTVRSMVRGVDLVTRYGGEEFVILLPETDLESAAVVAERVRSAVEMAKIQNEYGEFGVTISIGVAAVDETVKSLDGLIRRANQAEHAAKDCGRNCVIAAEVGVSVTPPGAASAELQ